MIAMATINSTKVIPDCRFLFTLPIPPSVR